MRHALVVDDRTDNLSLMRALLEAYSFTVDEARNGAEALEIARRETPELVISDLMMPVMNGWEFLEAQKGDVTLATIPVVVVSAFNDKGGTVGGAAGFIKKPVELESLLRVVQRYCQ